MLTLYTKLPPRLVQDPQHNELMADLSFFEIRMRNDNIVEIRILPKSDICVEEVKILIKETQRITGGVLHPTLIIVGEFTTFSSRARAYSASAEGKIACTAEAYLINNTGHSIVGNFYLRFNKPVKPVKIFWKEKDALEWLKEFKVST